MHPPAFTAQKRAKYLHTPGARVVKGVLLVGPAGYVLAVLPATRHIDTQALALELGGPVRLADEAAVAQVFTDCEWGVVSPFGRLYGLTTLIDESLDLDGSVILEVGSHVEAVRLSLRDFERLERPRRLRFAR
jgi:Ala-tRNA(Pro) deacylase